MNFNIQGKLVQVLKFIFMCPKIYKQEKFNPQDILKPNVCFATEKNYLGD